jgi:N-acetylmuramoyl-L-alanine amidase
MGGIVSGQLIPGKLSVLVKPGHQSNIGARGYYGTKEEVINEQVANKVMAVLKAKQYGCESILKRSGEGGARYALTKKDVATCVISIHCNNMPEKQKGQGKGAVVLYKR